MSKTKPTTTITTTTQFDQSHLDSLPTTSSKIRYLSSLNLTRSEISKVLNIRYQWVRNVLITPLKKS